MSFWSLYFITKTVLHHMGYLQVQLGWNVLLGLYVYWPIQSPRLRWLRLVAASIAAITLLWREGPLPPPAYVWQQAQLLSGFSMEYLLELLGRLVNYQVLLIVAAALLVYQLLARRVRFASFAWLGLLSVLLWPSASQQNNMAANAAATDSTEQSAQGYDRAATASNSLLERFFEVESAKQLSFDTSATKDFDVILVHVCSLAWDDLSFVNLSDHPFITNANVIFKQFNSATSYSGPASLRVLHGSCGQQKHSDLYSSANARCFVLPSLEKAGFQTHALLNHDGKFDNFAKELEERAGLGGKLELPSGPGANLRSFDNSLIYNDFDMLSKWQARQTATDAKPAVLYYNTITMHDGVRSITSTDRNSLHTYQPRAQQMLDDFERFKAEVKASGRPTILLMVPEHGANLRGDAMQIAGMREIPSPRITLGPALVHLINAPAIDSTPVTVDAPMSYFDLFTLLNDMLTHNPFAANAMSLASRVNKLQGTQFVSESATATVMQTNDGQYWVRSSAGSTWVRYSN